MYPRSTEIEKFGQNLIDDPVYNKSLGFTEFERKSLELEGLFPDKVMTIEQQAEIVMRDFNVGIESIA